MNTFTRYMVFGSYFFYSGIFIDYAFGSSGGLIERGNPFWVVGSIPALIGLTFSLLALIKNHKTDPSVLDLIKR